MDAREKLQLVAQQIRQRSYFEAQSSCEEIVHENPDWATARFSLAQIYLSLGKYKDGFRELECRWQIDDSLNWRYREIYDFDKWWDGSSLDGKTILLFCEQGLGDGIQFARYIDKLKGKIIVHAHRPLAPLLQAEVIVADIGETPEFPAYDYVCSTMSLPHLLQDLEPDGRPYLTAEKRKIGGVGVIWGGTPGHPLDADPYSCRSIPVHHFHRLNAELISLQLEHRPDLGEPWFPSMIDQIHDARDTAEIMLGMDLIITCDTSTAHLAGALGCPCWLLLPYIPCWRWGIDSESTPWYNSVRIFRQKEPGNWDAVFDEVARQLASF